MTVPSAAVWGIIFGVVFVVLVVMARFLEKLSEDDDEHGCGGGVMTQHRQRLEARR